MKSRHIYKLLWLLQTKYVGASLGNNITINGKCIFTTNTNIGNNCHFNGMTVNGDGRVQFLCFWLRMLRYFCLIYDKKF